MLYGERITLRPIRETDLDEVIAAYVDIRNRGSFYPLDIVSESAFRHEFAENGFWQKEHGRLLIVSSENELAGQIEFFKPVSYWDAFELAYYMYDKSFSAAGTRPRRSSFSSTTCSRRRRSTESTWSSSRRTLPLDGSRRSVASRSKGRFAARSSTRAETTTCSFTRCSAAILAPGVMHLPPSGRSRP